MVLAVGATRPEVRDPTGSPAFQKSGKTRFNQQLSDKVCLGSLSRPSRHYDSILCMDTPVQWDIKDYFFYEDSLGKPPEARKTLHVRAVPTAGPEGSR